MAVPETMRAVKVRAVDDVFVDETAPVPSLRPGYFLIRVHSVALNPTDWKGVRAYRQDVPHTIGCDVAGIVVAGGEQTHWNYRPGDRVAGLCYGLRQGDPTNGAFGEYALLKGCLSLPVPDHVSDAEAATIPVGINTIGQALYQTMKLPLPVEKDTLSRPTGLAILINGGATATGMFAVQFARLSGCYVLTTCSPRNFSLMKTLGAHEVFDYHDGRACSATIRAATQNDLRFAFDCVAEGDSLQICADALTTRPGEAVYTATLPVAGKFPRRDVQHGWTSGYTAFGESYHFLGEPQPAKPDHLEFARGFWKMTAGLLRERRLQLDLLVHQRDGGLAGIPEGLAELQAGQVSAGKLVYTIEDHS
ncbi:zinc-binding alcohol dehydrogenase family protein [Aspergillus clavatus NRRL 1]|uniref:Zinc-binding oxidoreductase ToxD, putative n=1 Tax=Aspergillus clavatus (strain ATCC 1007 / CBS 513.65 / DSM 816 / NCTC 3887 / NRRL 1 / QM 1276 / 107) TaxID=344612 RepID=A1CUU0_ASPCL|nr:zinc-binding oxidoreductase ToxD, putative [Aspergillus clavatus NRRL 1]EAW07077.1 zinc-binding oxidoreductase ToxD, putative [Aspergillus clavatus NRRL 1]